MFIMVFAAKVVYDRKLHQVQKRRRSCRVFTIVLCTFTSMCCIYQTHFFTMLFVSVWPIHDGISSPFLISDTWHL